MRGHQPRLRGRDEGHQGQRPRNLQGEADKKQMCMRFSENEETKGN